jgi:hypothetical protein
VSTQLEQDSARKAFIKQFGAEKGLTASVLESIWNARKHGYHKPYDAPFAKFRTFFNQSRPSCPFRPDTIQPGDVIGFLSQMQEGRGLQPRQHQRCFSINSHRYQSGYRRRHQHRKKGQRDCFPQIRANPPTSEPTSQTHPRRIWGCCSPLRGSMEFWP